MPSKRGRSRKRQHVYKKPKDKPGAIFTGTHHCATCGKWCYVSRDDAEDAVRRIHPGATVHYYECGNWWHFTSMTAVQVEAIRRLRAAEVEDPTEW